MKLEEIRIKNFEKEDKEHVKRFAEEVNASDQLDFSISEQMFEFILSTPAFKENTYIAYDKDKMAALMALIKDRNDSSLANLEIIVHSSYRKQGLGKKLYELAIGKAKEAEVKAIKTMTKEHCAHAVKALRDRGFEVQRYMWKMDYTIPEAGSLSLEERPYSIRQIGLEDTPSYIAMMNAGFKKEGEALYNEDSFPILLSAPDKYVFFVELEGKPVATAAISFQEDIRRGYIHNVTVYKDYRGRGLGEITLRHCINTISQRGFKKAALGVDGENRSALNLYKKIGFVEIDTDVMLRLQLQ